MDKDFDGLLKGLYERLKPLGWRKDGANYRFFGTDGLCRIINLQRNRWNSAERCEFVINIGLYFEKGDTVQNRKFKEYDCLLRQRVDSTEYGGSEWWCLNGENGELAAEIEPALRDMEDWFSHFPTKEATVRMILDGTAERYSHTNVMHYSTAKLLAEMGYPAEVYRLIKDTKTTNPKATLLIELAEQLRDAERGQCGRK